MGRNHRRDHQLEFEDVNSAPRPRQSRQDQADGDIDIGLPSRPLSHCGLRWRAGNDPADNNTRGRNDYGRDGTGTKCGPDCHGGAHARSDPNSDVCRNWKRLGNPNSHAHCYAETYDCAERVTGSRGYSRTSSYIRSNPESHRDPRTHPNGY